jgi:chaperonin GroES
LGDRIVVKITKNKEEKTSGGLLKPAGTDDTIIGEVVEVGSGLFTHSGDRIPITVKVGDMVLLHGTGVRHKNGSEIFQLYRESDILSIITKNKQ